MTRRWAILAVCLVSSLSQAEPAIRFTDVTADAGIGFTHTSDRSEARRLPETLGSGVAWIDYDGDGLPDLFFVNGGDLDALGSSTAPNALYRNRGDGTFEDVTASAGVGGRAGYGMGCAVGDYDNDGDPDLYVTCYGRNTLYRNDGDGMFSDATAQAGVEDSGWSSSAAWFDYDRDGHLDLYVCHYVVYDLNASYPPCVEQGVRTYCHPRHFEGEPDRLYRNNGDGTFTDATKPAGAVDLGGMFDGKGLGVVAADVTDDGYPDLYIANDDTPNYLFINNRDGTFTETALLAGCAFSGDGVAQAGMGVDASDVDGDGRIDLFVTNLCYETNALYRNLGDGLFVDATYAAHLANESYLHVGFGTGFADFDNDGWRDLFVANGHILDNVEQTSDTLTYAQRDQVFRSLGGGLFQDASAEAGEYFARRGASRGAAFADYDNDGDVDVVVTTSGGAPVLLRNDSPRGGNWARVRLEGRGSARDGIGARVSVTAGDRMDAQEVKTGSSYLSASDARLHFGLGGADRIDRLEVRWGSGGVQILQDLPANREIVVVEPE